MKRRTERLHRIRSHLLRPLRGDAARAGFTLLETVIALAIMVIAFGSILSIESSSLDTTLKAKQLSTVSMLARGKMAEIEQEIEGKKFEEIRQETNPEPFAEPFKEYSWKREIKEVEFPNISAQASAGGDSATGTEAADGGNSGGGTDQVAKLVSNYLSKAVREVKLTITWKKGGHERNYSVSMFWVDLNHEFQLSL